MRGAPDRMWLNQTGSVGPVMRPRPVRARTFKILLGVAHCFWHLDRTNGQDQHRDGDRTAEIPSQTRPSPLSDTNPINDTVSCLGPSSIPPFKFGLRPRSPDALRSLTSPSLRALILIQTLAPVIVDGEDHGVEEEEGFGSRRKRGRGQHQRR